MPITEQDVWEALERVTDPEIPVVSLIDMGIIREVDLGEDEVKITIAPTFSGCPALHVMKQDIRDSIGRLTDRTVRVETRLSPPWSSDLITESGREKLKNFGLAPPRIHGGDMTTILFDAIACPYCESEDTSLKNSWGPTLCRMIFFCNSCRQPFEQFKPL